MGTSLLHFTSFLPLCRRLEELTISTGYAGSESVYNEQLLCSHLRGLGCSLKLLNLTTGLDSKELETAVGHHARPAALTLHVNSPAAGVWLPQLRQCNECHGSMPQSVWRCRHLTSLLCCNAPASIGGPQVGGAQCTSLRRLRLDGCVFDSHTFPASLCSALRQLGSLQIFGYADGLSYPFAAIRLASLPPDFSQLSSLRRLVIKGASIKPPSLETFRRLPGLTALHLRDCLLESLPDGPYLSNLKSLDLSYNSNRLASPLPFAATAARGLQALCIDCNPGNHNPYYMYPLEGPLSAAELHEWWQDVQWKLHCFPRLKVLAMELDPDKESAPEVEALLDEIRSTFPSCELDLYGDLDFYPEYSGQAESL
ncbi:hypothetical protein COHA_004649 [Chlorella ohadii]|uniref:Uncharacterized protein n=1 Tax=Chlorella ohadii TaxID=2649997 RepID=A0AAD5DWV8_9CHLO|nr:hypothetical protein COHA_004649 [Chlorella ohadii]